jgi:Cu(I)/Ag(I) efflux system membrane protein CusA/SilA
MVKKLFSRKYNKIDDQERLDIIEKSSKQVSRGVFYSTIIIITSFLTGVYAYRSGGQTVSSVGLH